MIPLLVSSYIEHTPSVFLWVVLAYASMSFFCVLILFFIQNKLLNRQSKDDDLKKAMELRSTNNSLVPKYEKY